MSRTFEARIEVRAVGSSSRRKVHENVRKFSYVQPPPRAPDKPEYVRAFIVMELAKLFADSCVTIVTDETIT